MILFLVRLIFSVGAGYLLFRLWQATRSGDRWIDGLITLGFLMRAFAGTLLFWISWARLPLARSLQLGDGLWFYARDALLYFPLAVHMADSGIWTTIMYTAGIASVAYVKTLAAAILLFGPVTSVALLMNLFCYLGVAAIIVRWAKQAPGARLAARIAIVALSFSPAVVLWSLQPLKDTFFQFMLVAFAGACVMWQRAWTGTMSVRALCAAAVIMMVALMAMAGTRWYFGFFVLAATCVFFLFVLFRSVHNRWAGAAAAAVAILLLSRAFVFGAGPYVPPTIAHFLSPMGVVSAAPRMPAEMIQRVEDARRGFDITPANTSISAGTAIARLESTHAPRPAPAAAPAPQPVQTTSSAPLPTMMSSSKEPPDAPQPKKTAAPAKKTAAPAKPAPAPAPAKTAPATPAPVPAKPVVVAAKPAPKPVVAPAVVAPEAPAIEEPPSHLARLLTGAASLVLPRSVGERLGLFHIGGGRGMFWFTELDTIVFDVVLAFSLIILIRRISAGARNPLVYFMILLTLMVAAPLAYVISNYGTLFRLREMIYLGLALLPLALMTPVRRTEPPTDAISA